MSTFPNFDRLFIPTVPEVQIPVMPAIQSIPEEFFDDLEAHIRELEHGLEKNERIAFVHNQTGESITVVNITRRGMAIILWGHDGNGVETNVFTNMNTFQIAFKYVDVVTQEKRRPIGFTQTP